MAQRLKVFLTVDTELWPLAPAWPDRPLSGRERDLASAYAVYVLGATRNGEFGLPFLLQRLTEHGLRATFLVESLSALVSGDGLLRETVRLIREAGQDVQLHAHTEWLGDCEIEGVPAGPRQRIADYARAEQLAILQAAATQLGRHAGGALRAFRAGSYGANLDTLKALGDLGIVLDTSYNPAFIGSSCALGELAPLRQPSRVGNVWELPITGFIDYPGHTRPCQICATSFSEMKSALAAAHVARWTHFTIVLHSSELVKKDKVGPHRALAEPDRVNILRFERLCDFLADNRDRFETAWLGDPASLPVSTSPQPTADLSSNVARTAWRMFEQVAGRVR